MLAHLYLLGPYVVRRLWERLCIFNQMQINGRSHIRSERVAVAQLGEKLLTLPPIELVFHELIESDGDDAGEESGDNEQGLYMLDDKGSNGTGCRCRGDVTRKANQRCTIAIKEDKKMTGACCAVVSRLPPAAIEGEKR